MKKYKNKMKSFFLACAAILLFSSYSCADTFSEVGNDFGKIFTSPLRLDTSDLLYIVPIGLTGWAVFNNDEWIREKVQEGYNDKTGKVSSVITTLGDGWFQLSTLSLVFAFGGDKEKSVAKESVKAFVEAGLLGEVVKMLSGRSRPDSGNGNMDFTGPSFTKDSFYSGHTTIAFAAAAVWGAEYHVEWLTYPLAALVGLTRIYNDKHWTSDVFFGAITGILIGRMHVIHYDEQRKNQDNEKDAWRVILKGNQPYLVYNYRF